MNMAEAKKIAWFHIYLVLKADLDQSWPYGENWFIDLPKKDQKRVLSSIYNILNMIGKKGGF